MGLTVLILALIVAVFDGSLIEVMVMLAMQLPAMNGVNPILISLLSPGFKFTILACGVLKLILNVILIIFHLHVTCFR